MNCPNCSRSFRAGGNGLAFHLTWCKPAQPETPAVDDGWQALTPAQRDAIRHPAPVTPVPTPVVARAPRGRKLTRKERRARLHALLAPKCPAVWHDELGAGFPCVRPDGPGHKVSHVTPGGTLWRDKAPVVAPTPVQRAHKAPAAPKGPKMPASTGKHARCVAHVPMTRTAPGVAYACFDVTPDADAIAERAAFVADIDASWNAHHAAFIASQMAGDGLVPFRYAETAEDARADRWIDTRVPGWRAGFNSAGTYRPAKDRPAPVFVPTENSNNPRELLAA